MLLCFLRSVDISPFHVSWFLKKNNLFTLLEFMCNRVIGSGYIFMEISSIQSMKRPLLSYGRTDLFKPQGSMWYPLEIEFHKCSNQVPLGHRSTVHCYSNNFNKFISTIRDIYLRHTVQNIFSIHLASIHNSLHPVFVLLCLWGLVCW